MRATPSAFWRTEGGIKYAVLTENRRQRDDKYRDAVDLIGSGDAEKAMKGMKALDKKGWIVEMKDRGQAAGFSGETSFLKASDEGASALIVGTTNKEGDQITARLREELKARGRITGEERQFPSRHSTDWTDAQKADSRNYQPGMVVEFHKAVPGVRRQEKGKRETVGRLRARRDGDGAGRRRSGRARAQGRHERAALPMGFADRFQVYQTRDAEHTRKAIRFASRKTACSR